MRLFWTNQPVGRDPGTAARRARVRIGIRIRPPPAQHLYCSETRTNIDMGNKYALKRKCRLNPGVVGGPGFNGGAYAPPLNVSSQNRG